MVYYLTHYDVDTFPFLIKYLKDKGYEAEYLHTPTNSNEYVNDFRGALHAVNTAKAGDTIITYLCSAGVLCWWISMLKHKKIKVISSNLTLKDDQSMRTRLMRFLYRKAVKSKRYIQLINSRSYEKLIQKVLHTSRPLPLLRDYNQYPGYAREFNDNGKRIFCGGNTHRDWDRCLHIAKLLPQWKFLFVGFTPKEGKSIPKNVKTFSHLPFPYFMQGMRESTFVLNIAKYNCPAGLIVLMQSAWEGRVIAMNENDVTKEYITDERGIISKTDEEIAQKIELAYSDQEGMKRKVHNMQDFLTKECSAENYCESMLRAIEAAQSSAQQ